VGGSQEADGLRGEGDRHDEAGHAVCGLLCPHADSAIRRIALNENDLMGGASYVPPLKARPTARYDAQTR